MAVKPAEGRPTIGVIAHAERSSRCGRAEALPAEAG